MSDANPTDGDEHEIDAEVVATVGPAHVWIAPRHYPAPSA